MKVRWLPSPLLIHTDMRCLVMSGQRVSHMSSDSAPCLTVHMPLLIRYRGVLAGAGKGSRRALSRRLGEQESAAVRQLGPHALCRCNWQCLPCNIHAWQQGNLPPHGEQLA